MIEPRLQVQDSLGHRRLVVIDKHPFTVGRRSTCDLHLTDTDVSRDHAEIDQIEGRFIVRDRGSRFGTFVNGEQITEAPLQHGDNIRLGRAGGADLLFLVSDEPIDSSSGGSSIVDGFRQVTSLLESLHSLGGARVLDDVLALVMDAALEVTGAERGFIMLANRTGVLEFKIARAQGKISLQGTRFDTSRKIPEEVFATGREVVADLREADMAQAHEGTLALGIRHVLCVPLRIIRIVERAEAGGDSRPIGVLYLDSRQKATLMSRTARTSLSALAAEAAAAIENARLYREAQEKARFEEELRIASQIQQALLPPPKKSAAFFDAIATSVSCREIGGDFFDYLDLPDGRFGFTLGDVSGKGTPAALLTAVIQGILAGQAQTSYDPSETMARVNRGLLSRAIEARFATAFFGVLEPSGRLTYCNAGHNPPFLFSKGHVERLEAGGMVLGLFAAATYDQAVVQLSAGDVVVVFSDGVSEAPNVAGDEFGDDRIRGAVGPLLGQPVQSILDGLLVHVREFAGAAPQNDDITALVLRYQS